MTATAQAVVVPAATAALAAAAIGALLSPAVDDAPPLTILAFAVVAAMAASRRAALAVPVVALAAGLVVGVLRVERLDADPLAARMGEKIRGRLLLESAPRGRAPFRHAEARLLDASGGRVLVRLVALHPPARGAILEVEGRLRRPRPPADGFDEEAWLARRGIRAVLRVEGFRVVGRRGGVEGAFDRARTALLATFRSAGDDDAGRLVGGLVLGADEDLSEEAREAFRASGLAHVLAVSGQNVALLAAFLAVLVWLAGGTRRTAQLASIAAIALYVGVVGPSPSVVRAGVAGGLTAAAWLVSRAADRWHLLAAGALVLLVDNPYAVRDPGFQLSFAAVVAILTLVPRLGRSLDGAPLPRWLRAPLAVSVACTLATAPIGYAHFGRVSVAAAVPANVAALPAVAPILWLGLTAAAVRPVAPGAAARVASLARLPARYLLLVARAGAALDRAVAARRLPLAAGTVAAGVGVALLAGPPFRRTRGCR